MAEVCDALGCDQRAAYIVEPGYWVCPEHARNNTTTKENVMTDTTTPAAAALARLEEWGDEWENGEFDYTASDFWGLVNEVRGLLAPTNPGYPSQYPACGICGADEGKHCTITSGTGVPGDITGGPRQWPHFYRAKPGQPGPAQPFVAVKDEPNHYRGNQ